MKDNNKLKELIAWGKELKDYLQQKLTKKASEKPKYLKAKIIYLAKNKWLENYKQTFLNEQKDYNNFNNLFSNFVFLNKRLFSDIKDINNLPKLFALNKNCWLELYGIKDKTKERELIFKEDFYFKGKFYTQILILKLTIINNCKVYCFFYLDEENDIKQGYIKINNKQTEKEIMNSLKDGPLQFINNLRNNKSNIYEWLKLNYFELVFPVKEKINPSNNYISFHGSRKSIIVNPKNKKIDDANKEIKNFMDDNYDTLRKSFRNSLLSSSLISSSTLVIDNIQLDNNNYEQKNDNKNKIKNSIYISKNYYNNIIDDEDILNPQKKIEIQKKKRRPSIYQKRKNKNFKDLLSNDNDKNNNFDFFLPKKAIHRESIPGVIGLTNVGATCYMNSTLQCFSNLERLRDFLLEEETYKALEKNKQNKKLSFALAEVLKNLWKIVTHRTYAPNNFKNAISEENSLFKGIEANDPKDLILFILESIHKELNKANNQINIINNNWINNQNFFEVYNNFINDFKNKNNSIISDEFYGLNYSETICGICKTVIYIVQSYNIIFFPLEEVRKFMNYNHNNVRIIECFEYYQKYEMYPSFHCNSCRNDCQGYQQTRLVGTPRTLIINLNRGKGLQYDVKIIFEEYLNLAKYIVDRNSPNYYELTGLICHFGSNDMGGHFIAFCKNSNNAEWYKYNDQIVTKSSFNEVRQSRLPYVLFYSYIQK